MRRSRISSRPRSGGARVGGMRRIGSGQRLDRFGAGLAADQHLPEVDHAFGDDAHVEHVAFVADADHRNDPFPAADDDVVEPGAGLEPGDQGLGQPEDRAGEREVLGDRQLLPRVQVDQVSVVGGKERAKGAREPVHADRKLLADLLDECHWTGFPTSVTRFLPSATQTLAWLATSRLFISARPRLVSMRATTTATTFSWPSRRAKMCSRFFEVTMISRK